jgi:hypothetical protein
MTPKKFLALGGIIFIAISLLGMFHLLGPTSAESFFSARWYFDATENCVYLIVGIVALLLAFTAPAALHRGLTGLIGVAGLLLGLWTFFLPSFMSVNTHLQSPSDAILLLVIGLWALWSIQSSKMA